jgi:hypothetical protein
MGVFCVTLELLGCDELIIVGGFSDAADRAYYLFSRRCTRERSHEHFRFVGSSCRSHATAQKVPSLFAA